MEKLNLTQEWDKVFPKSDKVDVRHICTNLHTFCTPERLDNGCKRGQQVQRMQQMQNTNLR